MSPTDIAAITEALSGVIREQAALIINAIRPMSYNECECCHKVTTNPYRTHEDHGSDFCSVECLEDFTESCKEDCLKQAMDIASKKVYSYPDWEGIEDAIDAGPVLLGDILIRDMTLESVNDEEQTGGVDTDEGWREFHYAVAEADYVFSCTCKQCNKEFTMKADRFLKRPACPHCSPKPSRRKKEKIK